MVVSSDVYLSPAATCEDDAVLACCQSVLRDFGGVDDLPLFPLTSSHVQRCWNSEKWKRQYKMTLVQDISRVPSFELRVKTSGLTLVGLPGNVSDFHRYLVEVIAWNLLGSYVQGENARSSFPWLDPVTVALERRFLYEGVAFEEPFS